VWKPRLHNILWEKGLISILISISQLCDNGMSVNFNKSVCLVTNEKREVIMRGIKSEGNCYLGIPLSQHQTEKLTEYNQVMISEKSNCVFQYTAKGKLTGVDGKVSKPVRMEEILIKCNVEQNVLTLGYINLSICVVPKIIILCAWINQCYIKNHTVSVFFKENTTTCNNSEIRVQLGSFHSRVLNDRQPMDMKGKLDIMLQKVCQLCEHKPISLMHANLGQVSLTSLKQPTTRNNFPPIIVLPFSLSNFRNIFRILPIPLRLFLPRLASSFCQNNQITMIFKNNPQTTKEKVVSEPLETSPSIPKVINPITAISSEKSKKGNTTKPSTKTKKSKRGESKIALSMTVLYKKENPFISTVVEPSVGTSVKDLKDADVEEKLNIATDVATSANEKGNPDKTLTVEISESCKNLSLEDLNVAIKSTKNMDLDESKTGDESTGKDTDQLSLEKVDD